MKSYKELREYGIFINNRKVDSYGIFVGRPTVLGNPFKIEKDGSREEVIEKYRTWFSMSLKRNEKVRNEFLRICGLWILKGKIALSCFCFPEACHAQVIASAMVWYRHLTLGSQKLPF